MGNTNVRPQPKPRSRKQVRWKGADRPAPPGKPSLSQENGILPDVIQINWPKPEKDGGSSVTAYVVEHRRVGTTHWQKSSQFPVAIPELAVQNLEAGWRYQFRVRAENAVGLSDPSEISEPFTPSLKRSAIAAPKFTQDIKDCVAHENDKVEFEAHFLGQPPPNICWFKDGFEIFSGNRTRITTISDKSLLTIIHCNASDEGEIRCTATNKAGHTSTKAKLTIEATPSITLPKSYQDADGIIFEIGETIRLSVSVYGRPTPLVFWSHNGESIQNDDRHEIEYLDRTATVKIENALRNDRGEYQIRAVNKLGQDMASFLVTITNKPTPPGRARVLLTSGKSVTLSWSIPEDDGGCKIGNYIIEYYRLGWDVWLKAATSRQLTTMLGDLIEGSQYKFRVKAESPFGVSEPSEESETVFIPDEKKRITTSTNEISDVDLNSLRNNRSSSSPRVSFALREDVPMRPERKKTGKTPEASPRMKRKQIPSLPVQENLHTPPVKSNRKSPSPVSPRSLKKSPSPKKGSPTTPPSQQTVFSFPEMKGKQVSPSKSDRDVTKSPSPDIVITEAEVQLSPERIPVIRRRSFSESEKRKSLSPSPTQLTERRKFITNADGKEDTMKMRPLLVRQEFSGSSEFMLVLCPEEERGAQFKKLGISFEENSIPPPLSLSAPELGIEPAEQPPMKRSSSSTELLNYRLMERLNDAYEEELKMRKEDDAERRPSLEIPTIQINSEPTQNLVGLEKKPVSSRRLSVILKNQSKFPDRRYSLKSASEMGAFDNKLHKFQETDESRRELMEYRKLSEFREEQNNVTLIDEEEWLKDYVESIPSEEESEISEDERRMSITSQVRNFTDDEEEVYNPRNKMVATPKPDDDKPFEILTVRKEPPDSNIIPKPILKKKIKDDDVTPRRKESQPPIRKRSFSLIDYSESPQCSPIPNKNNDLKLQRDRSNSLIEETIDVSQIKKSPNNIKRRSFSLIPSQANFIKESFKSKIKKEVPPASPTKINPVSALANFTSIAGAGLVIPEKMMNLKVAEEEAKVVVDFYGDIVKSFGGKSKPTAEFSRTIVSKYDTYEERTISEIKPKIEEVNPKGSPDVIRRQDSARDVYTPPFKPQLIQTTDNKRELSKNESRNVSDLNIKFPAKVQTDRIVFGDIKRNDSGNVIGGMSQRNIDSKLNFMTSSSNNEEFSADDRSKGKSQSDYFVEKIPDNRSNSNITSRNSSSRELLSERKSIFEKPQSRSSSVNRRRKPKSRDASTSPVRFEEKSSRSSLERDYYDRRSVASSRSSSLTRRSESLERPRLREITTQTSFRIEPKTTADVLKKQEELANVAEKRMRGVFEYFTDLAMVSVATYFYLFHNEFLAIPVLGVLVYRQLSEKMVQMKENAKKRLPNWIRRRFEKK